MWGRTYRPEGKVKVGQVFRPQKSDFLASMGKDLKQEYICEEISLKQFILTIVASVVPGRVRQQKV